MIIKFEHVTPDGEKVEVKMERATLIQCLAKIEHVLGVTDKGFAEDFVFAQDFEDIVENLSQVGGIYKRSEFSDMDNDFSLTRVE
jgi:hypothetical protein